MIKNLIYIGFIFVLFFASCRNGNDYEKIIQHAENIIEEYPDSALMQLRSLDNKKSVFDEALMMRFEMLKASAQNKAYIPFRTDSIAQIFTSYYDNKGTNNQKVMAHYLLGCTYRDLGDSPQTMKCFIDAVESADTTSNDCDYKLLSCVYGQLGVMYIDQELGNEALRSFKKAEKYALQGKDTLMAIMCISQRSLVYELQEDLNKIVNNSEYASGLYKKYGYDAESASVLGAAIQALVLSGQYQKARKYINRYEKESGFFDTKGNIIKGKEQYYYVKGLYYLRVKSDSAAYLFRKELRTTDRLYDKMSAVYGLHAYYQEKSNKDSLLKYAEMLIELKDSVLKAKSTESIRKMASLYQYSHIQKVAEEEKERVERYQFVLISSVVFFLLVIIICVLLVMYLRIKDINRNKDFEALRGKYDTMLELLDKENKELEELKNDKLLQTKIIEEKETYILELKNTISALREELSFYNSQNMDDIDKKIREKAIFVKFEKFANIGGLPSENDWALMKNVFDDLFPQFKQFLLRHNTLKECEYRLCILVRLCFPPKVIHSFLGISSSYVSVMRSRLCLRIFGEIGVPKDFDNRIRKIR